MKKFFELPAPVLSLALIGVLLLGALLYYRAVRVQRFLEPALAMSTPRIAFAKNIRTLLSREFAAEKPEGIRFAANSIYVEQSLLSGASASGVLNRLSRVFLAVLRDRNLRGYVDFVLISTKYRAAADERTTEGRRFGAQRAAESVLSSLYRVSPELRRDYETYFAATALHADHAAKEARWVEFRFLPSERLHIDVLTTLEKYVR
ncbi:MAG: hypothetical protein M1497_09480 [Nitrospirae bacterium]|nr:hypothetical protein [Nitrospirota bacterium]